MKRSKTHGQRLKAVADEFHSATIHRSPRGGLRFLTAELAAFGISMKWEWSSPEAQAAGEAARREREATPEAIEEAVRQFGPLIVERFTKRRAA